MSKLKNRGRIMNMVLNRMVVVILAVVVIVFSSFAAIADSGLDQEFHYNVQHGYLDRIKKSLQDGADVNSNSRNGLSALHEAMRNEVPLSVAQLLIENKANLEITDSSGQTPVLCWFNLAD
jgi:ankyrin repeat protein